jgi:DNA-binding transcriptional LysR family regulator
LVQEHLQAGRLIHLLPDWTEPKRVVHALYPHRRHLSAKVRAFIDSLVERFADDPPWRAFDVPTTGKA